MKTHFVWLILVALVIAGATHASRLSASDPATGPGDRRGSERRLDGTSQLPDAGVRSWHFGVVVDDEADGVEHEVGFAGVVRADASGEVGHSVSDPDVSIRAGQGV